MIANQEWNPTVDAELEAQFETEGLQMIGVCDAEPGDPDELDRARSEYRSWIAQGKHGTMAYMAAHEDAKWRPDAILPGVRSLIFVGLNYYRKGGPIPAGAGRVARYAWGRDYHKELGKRLRRLARGLGERYPTEQFRSYTDATPLAERWYTERTGIGFTGRNTLLINGSLGSWFVIGEILSTRHFEPSEEAMGRHGACPSSCRRCIDVCPTGALYDDRRIDASRCISYLTIEHDGIIPEELRPRMGGWIFGCDLCQEVCPLNLRAQPTTVAGFQKPLAGEYLDLAKILAIPDDEAFTRRFAGSPLMRARRRKLLRNASIVAANLNFIELVPQLRALAGDRDEIIAHHADWAHRRIVI